MMMDTRRDFLKKAALLTGATGLAGVLPSSIQKALAINAPEGSTYMDAEHIVILMQENRSFDHCFGMLKGVRGFNDPRAIDLPNKNRVWLQANAVGETYAPFHLDIKATKSTWMNSLPHTWSNQTNARNNGRYDQWLIEKQPHTPAYAHMPLTLGYHDRDDIPFYYALADAFTVCDQNFCSSLTGTTPNRLFFWTGTIRDQQNEQSRACVWNEDAGFETLKWKTFPERLQENGVSWKCYQNEIAVGVGFKGEQDAWLSNFGDNPLEYFAQYNAFLHNKHIEYLQKTSVELPDEITALEKQVAALPSGDSKAEHLNNQLAQKKLDLQKLKTDMQSLNPAQFAKLSQQQKNLHQNAFVTNKQDPDYYELTELSYHDGGNTRQLKVPKGDVLHQFREDVKTGKLPTVSWLVAPENFSDHPSAPWYGAWYVSETLDILTQNPDVWKKTIFILNYDENDGYFDHVPPFVAPHSHKPGTGLVSKGIDTRVEFVTLEQELERKDFPHQFDKESPIGLGYRVPMVIASPWSKGGWVNSEVFDHTSCLQFLEHFLNKKTGKEIRESNISDWRRTICGDLSSAFRPYNGEKIATPVFLAKDAFIESIHKAKFAKLPSDFKALNAEEIAQLNAEPHSSPYMPQQEKGIKPSCAIPYQLYAEGRLSADKKAFEVRFEARDQIFGKTAVGSPFNVYAPGKYLQELNGTQQLEPLRAWAYAVKPGDNLTDTWPLTDFENSNYHLRVYGPNGFFREFTGNAHDPAIAILCEYEPSPTAKNQLTGNIKLALHNLSNGQHHITITDNAYKTPTIKKLLPAKGQSAVVLNLHRSFGWYDFSVVVDGNNLFVKRYAGRVETGKASYSDPLMGKVV
jgi:phospholipase C